MTDLQTGVVLGGLLLAVVVGQPVAKWVHYKYARDGHRAAKKAVPVARRLRIARFGALVRVLAVVVLLVAGGLLMVYMASTPQRLH